MVNNYPHFFQYLFEEFHFIYTTLKYNMTKTFNIKRVNKTNDDEFDLLSKDLNKHESCYQTLQFFPFKRSNI